MGARRDVSRMPPGHLIHRGRTVLLKHHRLLSGVHPHPPNSLAALRRSLDGGAEAVEFDIGRTRDEKFVLLHSSTLEHETSGTGPLRQVTEAQFKRLVLRDSDEPTATLAEVTGVLRGVDHRLKVQVDLKDLEQMSDEVASLLLQAMTPARENPSISMVVGSMGDWNLRLLRRVDSTLAVGLDFANYLDAPVDEPVDRPLRINAYGYLDDHPLGHSRALGPRAYLEERLSVLLDLVPGASEVYLRKEFLLRPLG